jgi:hypothetical protein
MLATYPKDGIRNGRKAVEMALRACELTQWERGAYLDTLAASYAESGDFDAAIRFQQRAVEYSKEEPAEVQTEIRDRIQQYRDKKPHRELPPSREGQSPSREGQSPSREGQSPSGETKAPSGETKAPSGETKAPSQEKKKPDGEALKGEESAEKKKE